MADDMTIKLPGAPTLRTLVNKGATARSKIATLNGDYGELIADAVDKHNLHAAAFKLVAKLQRQDPVKLYAFLTHFDDYRQKLELDKIAGAAFPGMEDDDIDTDHDGDMDHEEVHVEDTMAN